MAQLVTRDGWAILQPTGTDASLELLCDWCRQRRASLRATLFSESALLLRGWQVERVSQAEAIIFEALGFGQMESYPPWFVAFNARCERLGVAPGGLVQKERSRTAPEAAPVTMQPPHIEFGLGPHRPRVAGFFCEQPPAEAGGTALFFLPRAIELLPPALHAKLRRHGWWAPRCDAVQPATLRHPESGLETLQLYAFSHGQTHLALEGYRLARAERPELPQVDRVLYSGPDHNGLALVAAHGQLLPLSDPESVALFGAICSAARVHTWQRGDVLLFDNVLFGHARLPGRQPRKLHAIFADEVDTRTLRRADAPECVHRAAARACKGAIEITLAQLGPGGYWLVLAIVMLFPDWLFRWFGQRVWAVNKDGSRSLGYAS